MEKCHDNLPVSTDGAAVSYLMENAKPAMSKTFKYYDFKWFFVCFWFGFFWGEGGQGV